LNETTNIQQTVLLAVNLLTPRLHFLVSLSSSSSLTINQAVDRHSPSLLVKALTSITALPLPLPTSHFPFALSFLTLHPFNAHTTTTMEGTNQPPNWPPAPTVEDESPSGDQTTTATMPHVQNGASAPADGTDTHNAEPSTPVNNNATTNPTNNDAPTTPANAAPAAPPADRVQVVLKDQNGTQIAFGVKTNTRMDKVQNAFAERTSRPVYSLRFFFDGDRVLPEDTVTTVSHFFDRTFWRSTLTTTLSLVWRMTMSSRL
jgi:hypothetical protein